MWLLDKMLRRLVHRGELLVIDHDGREYHYGAPDPGRAPVTIRFTDRRVSAEIARDPATATGEAYMDARMLVERGDIRDLLYLARANATFEAGQDFGPKTALKRMAEEVICRIDRFNWKSRARRNAEHTYNLTSRLYELFLDEDRQYTCAYWTDRANSLETAQRDKKAHIAAKLNLKPGMRILDIGCGWGGLGLYFNEHFDAEVLGVALAPEQIRIAQERAAAAGVADKVRFDLTDYRDVTGTFDRIVSVGLLEHVSTPQYEGFFAKCRELLAPDGVMLSHCCGRMGKPGVTDRWTAKYIFPGGYAPALSEIVSVSERYGFMTTDVEMLRRHYGYTLEHWYNRALAAKDEIVAMYDERFFRMWQFYLAGSEVSFQHGGMCNYQVQYIRDRDAVPITRDYMVETENRLRAA
jgi:cyclopropane-fatty-acyl-phospholipid synthase